MILANRGDECAVVATVSAERNVDVRPNLAHDLFTENGRRGSKSIRRYIHTDESASSSDEGNDTERQTNQHRDDAGTDELPHHSWPPRFSSESPEEGEDEQQRCHNEED